MIETGHCIDIMRQWAAEGRRAQMCVTSPPYWGLRDYGAEPVDWPEVAYRPMALHPFEVAVPAMRASLGMEASVADFLGHLVLVFRAVRDVLADDGVVFANMGDSYAGSAGGGIPSSSSTLRGNGHIGGGPKQRAGVRASFRRDRADIPRSDVRVPGLKPKDLVGQPWLLALALQADGWYLRQDIIWAKPNPMPESVRDRCTKGHEYVFLLAKSERYLWNFDAVQEPVSGGAHARTPGNKTHRGAVAYDAGAEHHRTKVGLVQYAEKMRKLAATGSGTKKNPSMDAALAVMPDTRNPRSVWTIPSQPFSGAHFATFPESLVERCILAGSEPGQVVLDPFLGSGTTARVAVRLGRDYLGCDLNPEYQSLQRERLAVTGGLGL